MLLTANRCEKYCCGCTFMQGILGDIYIALFGMPDDNHWTQRCRGIVAALSIFRRVKADQLLRSGDKSEVVLARLATQYVQANSGSLLACRSALLSRRTSAQPVQPLSADQFPP